MTATPRRSIAFVFPAFPVLHQTFVLWEVIALRKRGIPIALYSLKRPSTRTQQPEAQALAAETAYLPSAFSVEVAWANLRSFARAPVRYAGVYARTVLEWWRDRTAGRDWMRKQTSADAPERLQTPREWLRGWFNTNRVLFLLKSIWLIPTAVYLGEQLRRRGIDHLHAHWASYSTTVALVIHWLYGIPFSFTAHAYDIYLVPWLLGVKVREARRVITCAEVNARFLAARGRHLPPGRLLVNYHGVDLDRFRPRANGHAREMPYVLTCGRLEPYKGHHILLRACAALSRPVHCVVVGEGPQRGRLERLARELGIADRVEFTGPLSQPELVEHYARADLFVLASVILETFGKRDVIPNVLAEAMAMRIPVVATNVSGIGELIQDRQTGRLVPPNDAGALTAVIEELLSDRPQRSALAQAGLERVRRDFDRDKNIEELATLFRSFNASPVPEAKEPAQADVLSASDRA